MMQWLVYGVPFEQEMVRGLKEGTTAYPHDVTVHPVVYLHAWQGSCVK